MTLKPLALKSRFCKAKSLLQILKNPKKPSAFLVLLSAFGREQGIFLVTILRSKIVDL